MEQEIHITLRFNLATGKVNLNEIVYRLKEIGDALMLDVLKEILMNYDDLIAERLSKTTVYGSKDRKGLGRHIRKSESGSRFCRGRKVRKRGYRQEPRNISDGMLLLPCNMGLNERQRQAFSTAPLSPFIPTHSFMDEYMFALFLPHTNMNEFPTVEEIIKKKSSR